MREAAINKKRIAYVDLAGGIMILMVLYSHALYPMWGADELNHVPWLYFFMPWFFYKAGMMYKPKEMLTEVRNGWRKLIMTFIIWSFIGWLVHIGWHCYIGDLTLRLAFYSPLRSLLLSAFIPLNSALWFLPILYLVRLLGNWLLPKVHIAWIVTVTLVLSLLFECIHFPLMPSWIAQIAWGLFFFTCGYGLKEYERKWLLIAVAAVVYVLSLITPIHAGYGGPAPLWSNLVWYPSCVLACVLFNNICLYLCKLADRFNTVQFPVLRYIGRNAMNFYVPHYIIFALVYNIIGTYYERWYPGWQGLVIVSIAYAVLLPVINWFAGYLENFKSTCCYRRKK